MTEAQKQKVREKFREKFSIKKSPEGFLYYTSRLPVISDLENHLIEEIEEQERELVGRIKEAKQRRQKHLDKVDKEELEMSDEDYIFYTGKIAGITYVLDIINSITKE